MFLPQKKVRFVGLVQMFFLNFRTVVLTHGHTVYRRPSMTNQSNFNKFVIRIFEIKNLT